MDRNPSKTAPAYGTMLLWLLLALLLATGIAYLLIRPFLVRVPTAHHSLLQGYGRGRNATVAACYGAGVARSINITGMPSTTGYVRIQATHWSPAA